jgi:menaquinone-dependent protoporphyrinogen IX oxidase
MRRRLAHLARNGRHGDWPAFSLHRVTLLEPPCVRGTRGACPKIMERKRITCPETGHLEEIDVERAPAGLLIDGCSRFQPRSALACTRECAKRMDRREHLDIEGHERILVVISGLHAQTSRIGEAIADALRQDNFVVELATLEAGGMPPLEDYDGVVIGAPVRLGERARVLGDYVRAHRDTLAAMSGFFFAVGSCRELTADEYIERVAQSTGWQPTGSASFLDDQEVPRTEIHELAERISDEIPVPLVEPSML